MRGRFAPSPTGDLHIGNARTALLAWLQVRAAGGRFVLRVEDLDHGRVREHYRRTQLDDLRWLGLDWDEGPDVGGAAAPYLQSQRQHLYVEALDRLAREGHLYGCHCSRREILAAASAPHAADEAEPAYPGTCRGRTITDSSAPGAIRFRVPEGVVRFEDLLHGTSEYEPHRHGGDFVVRRKDGIAAYQLAVVVDDAAMGITHVLRGSDLLPSTARQILLYEALGFHAPRWMHAPLLLRPSGERLAKRDQSLMLSSLRARDCPPERLIGWLAHSCGLIDAPREAMPLDLVAGFDAERIVASDTRVHFPDWMEAGEHGA